MTSKKAIIIGAGIAGIAAAIRLRQKGYEVMVYEANGYLGGKLSEIKAEGYRFDAGPSLFTMPMLVDDLFTLCDKNPKDYFEYEPLDIICKYFYEDGTVINAYANDEKRIAEFSAKTNEKPESIRRFMAKSQEIYRLTHKVFLESSLHKIRTYLQWHTFTSFLQILKIDSLRSMNTANEAYFKDPRMVQLMNRYATYNGSNPYKAPATLNIIPHLENNFGAYIPTAGMHSISQSLAKLAIDIGVTFKTNTRVEEILVENKKAVGVVINNEHIMANMVLSNMDVYFTYKKLLPNIKTSNRIETQERSSSALIFYWGINKTFPELELHNILFSADYKAEFEAIFTQKTISKDPTIYINISSKHIKTDAPEGGENWFTMINVPNNEGQNWDELIAEARKNMILKINRQLNTDIEKYIVVEEILDPRSIEARTASYQGSLYGSSSNDKFAAFFRQANFSKDIDNLYFIGGSVHPGGGIPLALLSAKITANMIV